MQVIPPGCVWDAIARSVLVGPRRWLAGMVFAAGLAFLIATGLEVGLRASDFYPANQPGSQFGTDTIPRRFDTTDPLVISVRGDAPLDMQELAPRVNSLAAGLARLPEVREVVYRVREPLRRYLETELPRGLILYLTGDELRRYAGRLDPVTMGELLVQADSGVRSWIPVTNRMERRDPLAFLRLLASRVSDWKGGFRIWFREGFFSSTDSRQLFLLVEPARAVRSGEDAIALLDGVEGVLRDFEAGTDDRLSTFVAGRARIVAWGFRTLLADSWLAVSGSALFVFAALVLFYRGIAIPAAIVATVAMGLLLTAAVATLVAGEINLFALLFSAVLIGIGIDFCIHIAASYAYCTVSPSGSAAEVLSSALRRPGRGIVFGALTTSAAFFALTASDYRGLAQIGALTGAGILILLGVSLTVFPFLLSRVRPVGRAPPLLRALRRVFGGIAEHPRLVLLSWLVFGAVAVAGMTQLVYEPHPWSAVVRGNPRAAELEQLASELGTHLTPLLVISEADTPDAALTLDRKVVDILDHVREAAGIAFFRSLTTLLPDVGLQQANLAYAGENPDLFSAERFRRNFETLIERTPKVRTALAPGYIESVAGVLEGIGDLQPVTLETLREHGLGPEIDRHLARSGERFEVVTYVYLNELPWSGRAVAPFLEAFEREGGGRLKGVRVTGEATRSLGHARLLGTEAVRTAAIAFGVILALLSIEFRSLRYVALAMLPLLCSVLITLGVMGWLRIPVSFLTIAVTPILLGIGIDDALHVIERASKGEGWREILDQAGGGITITSITTIGAFLSLCLSRHPAVVEFASITALGILVCWLSSLTLLPALLRIAPGIRSAMSRSKPGPLRESG